MQYDCFKYGPSTKACKQSSKNWWMILQTYNTAHSQKSQKTDKIPE